MSASSETKAEGQLYCPTCERTFASGPLCPHDSTRLVSLETTDALIGRVLDGRYTIVGKLGSGGMGAVYRATQHSVGREVAIKVVAANLVAEPTAIKRFLREAKLASKLSHPNAVGVLDFGQTADHVFFLVMELVDGRTLDDVLTAEPVLSPARVVRIGMQICDALEGAHDLQIVHRDLKPANVMLLASGRDLVKVLDFGIARSLAAGDTKMTHTGSTMGTPAFMPPEVASGVDFDSRADLYSLGCMLYMMATGQPPFLATSVQEMLTKHVSTPPAPMYGVPDALAKVVLRLLEKSPDHRFQTAAATREALEAAQYALQPPRRPVEPLVGTSDEQTVIGADPSALRKPLVLPIAPPPPTAPGVYAAAVAMPVYAAAVAMPVVAPPPPPPSLPMAPSKSRGLVLGLAGLGAIGVAVGVFFLTRSVTSDEPAAPPRPQPMKVVAPEPPDAASTPDATAVVVEAPADAAAVVETPPADAAAVVEAPAVDAASAVPTAGSAHHRHESQPRPDAGDDGSAPPF